MVELRDAHQEGNAPVLNHSKQWHEAVRCHGQRWSGLFED